ncbi:acetylserotonin O-methyltransferase-like [Andrographis paniculata]|uniref:acetylserotonin O-methyltransferase-like n=1 Tax=Andrographis paniculata TaxID=175694 RepID=UPI0021E971E2|nr:acetylserotonin O-methyltransferase-like [Andrographis paniculata]
MESKIMAAPKPNEEEITAVEDLRKCIFQFTELAVVRCVVELGIPDIVETCPDGTATLAELSSASGCSPDFLHRIMRFLTHHGVFKVVGIDSGDSSIAYAHTAISRLLTKDRMAPMVLFLSSPELVNSKLSLSKFLTSKAQDSNAFEAAHGVDFLSYMVANPSFNELFSKCMSCLGGAHISLVIEYYSAAFEGIGCLVDVGGSDGTALRKLVKACPSIVRAINFDLPQVVAMSPGGDDRIEHVGGDMFVEVPRGDAILLMSVLHDWGDEECVKILKNCKESIPKETGKVIIVETVVDHGNLKNTFEEYHLAIDMEMLSQSTKGKERNAKEWADLLKSCGFSKHTIKYIPAPISVIEAYP